MVDVIPQSSVTLKRGAKGETVTEVCVYNVDPDAAAAKAVEIYKQLCAQFPA